MNDTQTKVKKLKGIEGVGEIIQQPVWTYLAAAASAKFGHFLPSAAVAVITQTHANYQAKALIDLVLAIQEKVGNLEQKYQEAFRNYAGTEKGYRLSTRVIDEAVRDPEKVEILAQYFVNACMDGLADHKVDAYMDIVEQLRPMEIRIFHEAVFAKRLNQQEEDRRFSWEPINDRMRDIDAGTFHYGVRKLESLGLINENTQAIKDGTHFLTSFGEDVYDYFSDKGNQSQEG